MNAIILCCTVDVGQLPKITLISSTLYDCHQLSSVYKPKMFAVHNNKQTTLNKMRPNYLQNLDSLGTMGRVRVDFHYHNSQLIDANMV